jgi:MFS family permease
MDSAGACLGPLVALGLVGVIGLRWTFAATAIPGAAAALAFIFLVSEKKHEPRPSAGVFSGLGLLPSGFLRYLSGVAVAGLGDFSKTLLILWATQAWAPSWGLIKAAQLSMAFYVGYNVVYTASCYVSGSLADRFPKNWVLAAGYFIAVIPAAALLWPGDSLLKFAVIFGFSGLYMGVWETVEGTTAAAILPTSVRGAGFGLLATVNGLGDFVSSILVGFLWVFSPIWAMSFVIATAFVGAALIIGLPTQSAA